MRTHPPSPTGSDVDAAVARVLAAEREAREAVDAARDHAARHAEAVREHARQLEAQRHARVVRAHARVQRWLQAELDALAAAASALPVHDEPDAAAQARLEAALQALASALTTPGGAS